MGVWVGGTAVGAGVGVEIGVAVGVGDRVAVGDGVGIGVAVGVAVGGEVGEAVGVAVGSTGDATAEPVVETTATVGVGSKCIWSQMPPSRMMKTRAIPKSLRNAYLVFRVCRTNALFVGATVVKPPGTLRMFAGRTLHPPSVLPRCVTAPAP